MTLKLLDRQLIILLIIFGLVLPSINISALDSNLDDPSMKSAVGDDPKPNLNRELEVRPDLFPNNIIPINQDFNNPKSKIDITSIDPLATFSPLEQTRNSRYESHLITQKEVEALKEKIGVRDSNKNYNTIVNGHGTGLAPPTNSEWTSMIGNLEVVTGTENIDLPDSIDHSQSSYFPIVGNQLTQGSCAAWATNYYANGYLQAKDNNWLSAKTGNSKQLMSPAWTYNKANSGYDSGSNAFINHITLETIGSSTLSTMPYNTSDFVSFGNESAWREAPKYRCNGIRITDCLNIDIIKTWLNDGYLINIGIDVGSNSINYLSHPSLGWVQSGDDTVNSSDYFENWADNGGHAVAIVGYDDTKVTNGEIGSFKIVNSWGSSWGSSWSGNGFFWMTYKALAEVTSPAYSFYDKINYDPKLIATWEFSGSCSRDAEFLIGTGSVSSPIDSKKPEWNQFDKHNLPKFMCCDITEFVDSAGFESFFLDIGTSVNRTSISSFKLEYYGDGFSLNNYTTITNQSPDVPKSTPGSVTNKIYGLQVKINTPDESQYYEGEIESKGTTNGSINDTIIYEDFENEFPGNWSVGDTNSSYGEDYWGNTSYRSKFGSWSGYCAGVSEPIFEEDFDTGGSIPTGWTTYSENATSNRDWEVVNSDYNYVYGGSDYAAVADSDKAGSGSNITEWLYMTTSFNASQYSNLSLEFLLLFAEWDGDEYAQVLYSNGSTYPTFSELKKWTNTIYGKQKLDLSVAAGENEVYLAFRYHGTYDNYMLVDDVRVTDNSSSKEYDNSMISYMYQSVSLSSYDYVNLSYDYWLDSEPNFDFLMVIYYVNGWFYVDLHNGSSSGWSSSHYLIPTSATEMGFLFQSDSLISSYEGAYLDNIKLVGYKNLTNVNVKLDSAGWQGPTGTINWNYSINTSKHSDGKHTFTVRAQYGSDYAYDEIDINFDNTAPIAFTPGTTPSGWTSNSQSTITFSTTDSTSGIDRYELKENSGGFSIASSPYIFNIPSEGTHTITVRAYDNVNNSVEGMVNVQYDATAPNSFVPNLNPSGWTSDTEPEVSFSTTDSLSGMDHYEVAVDSDTFSTQTSPYTLPSLSDGVHVVKIRAYDKATNYVEVWTNAYIDSTIPYPFTPVADPSSWTNNSQPIITFTTTDETTEIDHYEVKIDSDSFNTQTSPFKLPSLNDGIHTITVRAYDTVDNYIEGLVLVYIDTKPPNPFKPSAGFPGWTVNTNPGISFSTSDVTSGINHYELKIDDGTFSKQPSPYFTSLTEGIHNITVRAFDLAGNYAEGYVNVYIDTTNPNPFTPTTDPIGWTSNTQSIVAFSTIDSISGIDYYKIKIDDGDFTQQTSPYKLPILTNGKHTVLVRVFDLAGNYIDGSVEVKIDRVRPKIEELLPEDNSWFGKSGFQVSWKAYDLTSGVDYYELDLDGTIVFTGGKVTHFDFKELEESEHVIKLKVFDNASNYILKETRINIDLTPPQLGFNGFNDDNFLSYNSPVIEWLSNDSGSGIDYYEVKMDNGEFVKVVDRPEYDAGKLTEGIHKMTIKSIDNVGNLNTITQTLFIDSILPDIKILTPNKDSTIEESSVTFTWSGTDNGSGIDHYGVQMDYNIEYNVDKNTSYTFNNLTEGSHYFKLIAGDKAGNVKTLELHFIVKTQDTPKPNGDDDSDGKGADNSGLIMGLAAGLIAVILVIIGFLFARHKKPDSVKKVDVPKSPPRPKPRRPPRDDMPIYDAEVEEQPPQFKKQRVPQEYIPPGRMQQLQRKGGPRREIDSDVQELESGDEVRWE